METSGEWREERLWVMRSIERIDKEREQTREELAVVKDKVEGQQKKSLDQAHAKIRELEASKNARLRQWAAISVGAAGFVTGLAKLAEFLWRK